MKTVLSICSSLRRAVLQLRAGNQEEGFFLKKDMGVEQRLRVCLTEVHMYLVDVGRQMQMAGE